MIVAVPLWEVIQKPLRAAVDQLHGDIVAITPMEQFTIIWMWAPLLLTIYLAAPWILQRLREQLMLDGVTMPDPARVMLDAGVRVGQDTVLWPGTILRGATRLAAGAEAGDLDED